MARRRQGRRPAERARVRARVRERKNSLQLSKLLGSFESCIGAEAFVASASRDRETCSCRKYKTQVSKVAGHCSEVAGATLATRYSGSSSTL